MENKKEFEKLTMLQIQYLTELEKAEKKRGVIGEIAVTCGVKHPSVSRFFKSCVEKGYLTEELEFTESGKRMLKWHQKVQKDVREYLERSGIQEGIEDVLRGMIENIDYSQLEVLVKSQMRPRTDTYLKKEAETIRDITDLIEYGNHEVSILILQTDGSARSMAEQGIEPMGLIRHNKRGSYLELTIREMKGISRVNGQGMQGYLTGLKYLYQGMYRNAQIRDDKVRIPIDACSYQNFDRGILRGNVMITVSCSVGEAHMPESTARLVFKL